MILDSLPVFLKKILTCFRKESENEQYHNTVKDLLLSNTVTQKDIKPHTAGQDAQYRNTVNPHVPLNATFFFEFYGGQIQVVINGIRS